MGEVPISTARELPPPGRYRHFKGGQYEVLDVARHSETDEVLVVYRSVDDPGTIWVRPVEMFSSAVQCPDGPHPRFELTERRKSRRGRYLARTVVGIAASVVRHVVPESMSRSHLSRQ